MAKPSRLPSACAEKTYFVGSETYQRRLLFHNGPLAEFLLETIYEYRKQQKFLLHSFVIMPDLIHLLLTPGMSVTLERALQLIKGGFSFRVKKEKNLHSRFGNEDLLIAECEMQRSALG